MKVHVPRRPVLLAGLLIACRLSASSTPRPLSQQNRFLSPDDRQLYVVRAERQLIRLSLADLTAASRDSSIRLGGTQFPLDPVEQPRATRRR